MPEPAAIHLVPLGARLATRRVLIGRLGLAIAKGTFKPNNDRLNAVVRTWVTSFSRTMSFQPRG